MLIPSLSKELSPMPIEYQSDWKILLRSIHQWDLERTKLVKYQPVFSFFLQFYGRRERGTKVIIVFVLVSQMFISHENLFPHSNKPLSPYTHMHTTYTFKLHTYMYICIKVRKRKVKTQILNICKIFSHTCIVHSNRNTLSIVNFLSISHTRWSLKIQLKLG